MHFLDFETLWVIVIAVDGPLDDLDLTNFSQLTFDMFDIMFVV